MACKDNHNIIKLSKQEKPEITLRTVKIALKRALKDYEDKRRDIDEGFDVYEYLQDTLAEGFAEPTIRKVLNVNNSIMLDPEKLLTLCDLINDYRPIEILISYMQSRIGLRK